MVLCLLSYFSMYTLPTFQNIIQKVYVDDITLEFQYNTWETLKQNSLMTRDYLGPGS